VRDLGTLVWVVLVFVGVVSSMVSTIRKQAQAPGSAGRPQPPRTLGALRYAAPLRPAAAPQPVVPPPVPPPPPTAARPEPRPPVHPPDEPRAKRAQFFAGKGQLVRAVIAAEVLGKPRGLNDEHFPR
jgi:hypothetical protein